MRVLDVREVLVQRLNQAELGQLCQQSAPLMCRLPSVLDYQSNERFSFKQFPSSSTDAKPGSTSPSVFLHRRRLCLWPLKQYFLFLAREVSVLSNERGQGIIEAEWVPSLGTSRQIEFGLRVTF